MGVLGQGALMSFLLGRCPNERVTREGAVDEEGFAVAEDMLCWAGMVMGKMKGDSAI